MPAVTDDLRYAVRQVRSTPVFTLAAVAALAVGIGANTAIFTVINSVLLDPLPYPSADRIVTIWRKGGGALSMPQYNAIAGSNPGLRELAAFDVISAGTNLSGADRPEFVHALHVSLNYFSLFGAMPLRGRTFAKAEDRPGGPRVAVMSFGLWQSRFGGSSSIVGSTVELGGMPYTIVGVLSPGFRPYPSADLWLPMQADPNSISQVHLYEVAGRLPGGTTLASVRARVPGIAKAYVRSHPEQIGNDDQLDVRTISDVITGDVRPSLLLLLGAVGLVLLIACANVANLLLARGEVRHQEMAVRAALGAGRGRLVRQLLTESLVLSILGAAAGLVLGGAGLRALLKLTSGDLPRAEELAAAPALDGRLLAFVLAATFAAPVLLGLLPALRVAGIELGAALKEASARAGLSRGHAWLRNLLVGSEVALAVVLLAGAMLLMRSFAALHRTNPGMDPHGVIVAEVSLAVAPYLTAQGADRLTRDRMERLERLPGVESAAVASHPPFFEHGGMDMIFNIVGRPAPEGQKFLADVQWRLISSGYFNALRIPLRSGRMFRDGETSNTVMINEALARKYWPGQSPLGQQILEGAGILAELKILGPATIIGVVADTRELGLDNPAAPTFYQLYSQAPPGSLPIVSSAMPAAFLVRTRASTAGVRAAIDREFLSGASPLPPIRVRSLDQVMVESTARTNFLLVLQGVFASVAILLAAVGIYGVLSYSVEQRRREMGIRAALGATEGGILRLVVGEGLGVALGGAAVGLGAALGLRRLMRSLLYGVQPSDPASFALAAAVLIAVALFACWLPARRAARLDPIQVLREE